jgi:hypothetical protein
VDYERRRRAHPRDVMLVTLVIAPVIGWAFIRPSWLEAVIGAAVTWVLFPIIRPRHVLALRRGRWLSRQVVGFVHLLLIAVGSVAVTGIVVLVFWESMELAKSVGLLGPVEDDRPVRCRHRPQSRCQGGVGRFANASDRQ